MATQFDLTQSSPLEAYRVLTQLVAPRPIALVSTLSAAGQGNLAPFSFFMMGGSNPPSCIFCPVNDRRGAAKDTLLNVRETGQYVINVCTRAMAEQINQCSYPYERGIDELTRVGFSPRAALKVKPPLVADSPVNLECRLHQVLEHGEGPLASNYVVGQILMVHVRDDLLDAHGLPDGSRIPVIGRLGGDSYTEVTPASQFVLGRPQSQ